MADTSLDFAATATRHLAAWLDKLPDAAELSKLIMEEPVIAGLVLDMAIHGLRGVVQDSGPLDIYTTALRLSVIEHGL